MTNRSNCPSPSDATDSTPQPTGAEIANPNQSIGSWRGLLILVGVQFIAAIPVLAIAWMLGEDHLRQAILAATMTWPLAILSYVPLLRWRISDSAVVPMYLAIFVRMVGTLSLIVFVRQIAAPLFPDSCLAYISAFYLVGLVAETSLAVWHLRTGR
ncbi:MAG: hypothetical protein JNL67_12495 [Planctomycetaceae bacterium]|nr:hypothetical protein [Planctomycetaceae bacterium]